MKNSLAITAIIFTLGFLTIPLVFSDSNFRIGELHEYERQSTGVAAVNNPVYKDECGSCHMAYPVGLLPSQSWKKIMSGLEQHFGDNAELDQETHQAINDYLLANSANQSDYRFSRKLFKSINPGDTPIRISDIPYFKHEHDEIPDRMVSDNPQVNSFSQCNACHAKAEQGLFNEHDIRIPGYGRWDD